MSPPWVDDRLREIVDDPELLGPGATRVTATIRQVLRDLASAVIDTRARLDGPLSATCRGWLRSVLTLQFEQAVDYSESREELLEWCGHIDSVAAATRVVPIWPDGRTAVQAGAEVADARGWS